MQKLYNYTLSRKQELNNLICGAFGSTWGHNFYMGTLNGSKLRNLMGFLIHAFELKLLHFNFPICLYREAMHLQRLTPTRI